MGETPRCRKLGNAEPLERTPDQKAEDTARKGLGTNLEATLHDNLLNVATQFFQLSTKLMRTTDLMQQIQQIQEGRDLLESNPSLLLSLTSWTTKHE